MLGSNIQTAQQQFQGNAFDHYHRAFSWRSRDCRAPNRGEPRLSLLASPRDHAELLAGLFPRGNDRGSASVAGVVRVASAADVIAGFRVLQQPNGPIAASTGAPSPLRHVFSLCFCVSRAVCRAFRGSARCSRSCSPTKRWRTVSIFSPKSSLSTKSKPSPSSTRSSPPSRSRSSPTSQATKKSLVFLEFRNDAQERRRTRSTSSMGS